MVFFFSVRLACRKVLSQLGRLLQKAPISVPSPAPPSPAPASDTRECPHLRVRSHDTELLRWGRPVMSNRNVQCAVGALTVFFIFTLHVSVFIFSLSTLISFLVGFAVGRGSPLTDKTTPMATFSNVYTKPTHACERAALGTNMQSLRQTTNL